MTFIHVEETIVLDRPELRRLAESTFRARLDRAAGNRELQTLLVEDCPFWLMGRAELLEQHPSELRR